MTGGFSASGSGYRTEDLLPAEFRWLRPGYAQTLGTAFPALQQYFSGQDGFEGPSSSELDDLRAPMTQGEEDVLAKLHTMLAGDPNQILADDVIARTLGGEYLSPKDNPGFADLLRFTNQTIGEEFDREDLEQRGLFARAGQVMPESSPFAKASADLSKARMDAIGKNTAAMTYQNYEAERGRMTEAIEQRRANAEFEFRRQYEGLQANALPRLIDELGFERGFEQYQMRINALMQALGITGGVTAPALGQFGSSAGMGMNFGVSLLGGGGGGGGTTE